MRSGSLFNNAIGEVYTYNIAVGKVGAETSGNSAGAAADVEEGISRAEVGEEESSVGGDGAGGVGGEG